MSRGKGFLCRTNQDELKFEIGAFWFMVNIPLFYCLVDVLKMLFIVL